MFEAVQQHAIHAIIATLLVTLTDMIPRLSGLPSGRLPAQTGRVSLCGSGSFTESNETVFDHGQLPQFQPGNRWPDSSTARSLGQHMSPLGTGIDWAVQHQVEHLREKVTALYSHLAPMPPFASGYYDQTPWLAHVAFMHDILHGPVSNRLPLNKLEMVALMRTVSYGMYESMSWLHPWQLPATGCLDKPAEAGEFREPGVDEQYYESRIHGRRWVVVPVLVGAEQWSMTIFDRCWGSLYIFDCGLGAGRTERIEAYVHLWTRFWNWLRLPWSFQYFVPAVTRQTHVVDSGLISVAWLMSVLRCRAGHVMPADDAAAPRADAVATAADAGPAIRSADLCLGDWLPKGCDFAHGGLLAVQSTIKAMLFNELGLAPLSAQDEQRRDHHEGLAPSTMQLLRITDTNLSESEGTPPPAQGVTIKPMMGSQQQHDTTHGFRGRARRRRLRIETVPYLPVRRAARPDHGPASLHVRFDADKSVHEPAIGVKMEAADTHARSSEVDDAQAKEQSDSPYLLKLHLTLSFQGESASKDLVAHVPVPRPRLRGSGA